MGVAMAVTLLFWTVSCRKDTSADYAPDQEQLAVREWLHANGGTYKNESISVLSPNKSIEKGRLDWGASTKFSYQGREYMEVPFLFSGKSMLEGNDSLAGVSFSLVVRRDSLGSYEGAVRTTVKDNKVSDVATGDKVARTTQSYQLLNGERATFWYGGAGSSFSQGRRITQEQARVYALHVLNSHGASGGGSGKGTLMMAPVPGSDCYSISTTTWEAECTVIGDPETSGQYDCTDIPVTNVYLICNSTDEGGSGGSDGSTNESGGSSDGGSWPPDDDDKEENIVKDSLANYPCAQDVLDSVFQLKDSIIGLINATFGIDTSFNLTFVARTYTGKDTTIDGELLMGQPLSDLKIAINTNILTKATKEYILVTMYHEAIHAFLKYEANINPSTFNTKYPDLDYYIYTTLDGSSTKIYNMLPGHKRYGQFINSLANAILKYNSNIPQDVAMAMAKVGIVSPSYLTQAEVALNKNEKQASAQSKGTKCIK
ncbi:MAG: hypothetical protein QM610_06595 [Chitinophagaceae bacterium]